MTCACLPSKVSPGQPAHNPKAAVFIASEACNAAEVMTGKERTDATYYMVRNRGDSSTTSKKAAAKVGLFVSDLGKREGRNCFGQRRCVRRARLRAPRCRRTAQSRFVHHGIGTDHFASSDHLAHWRASGGSRGRSFSGEGGRRPWHGDGSVVVREQADRGSCHC